MQFGGWKPGGFKPPNGQCRGHWICYSYAPDRIRTCGLRLRRATLYPAELRARSRGRRISRVLSLLERGGIISLGPPLPAASSSLPGTLIAVMARAAPRPLFGLAPGGVCHAAAVARERGALLPHRFTLACAPAGPSAVCSLLHFPSPRDARPLAGTLPCGARTFLDASEPRRDPHSPPDVVKQPEFPESHRPAPRGLEPPRLVRAAQILSLGPVAPNATADRRSRRGAPLAS